MSSRAFRPHINCSWPFCPHYWSLSVLLWPTSLPKRVRNSQVGVIPFQLRGLRTPRHTSLGCLSHRPRHTHRHTQTIRCAHRLKVSFISKLSLMLWLNTPSVYPGYIEKPPKHSKTFPVAVASEYDCVCLCVCVHI